MFRLFRESIHLCGDPGPASSRLIASRHGQWRCRRPKMHQVFGRGRTASPVVCVQSLGRKQKSSGKYSVCPQSIDLLCKDLQGFTSSEGSEGKLAYILICFIPSQPFRTFASISAQMKYHVTYDICVCMRHVCVCESGAQFFGALSWKNPMPLPREAHTGSSTRMLGEPLQL